MNRSVFVGGRRPGLVVMVLWVAWMGMAAARAQTAYLTNYLQDFTAGACLKKFRGSDGVNPVETFLRTCTLIGDERAHAQFHTHHHFQTCSLKWTQLSERRPIESAAAIHLGDFGFGMTTDQFVNPGGTLFFQPMPGIGIGQLVRGFFPACGIVFVINFPPPIFVVLVGGTD